MKWTDSNAILYVFLAWLGGVLLQLAPMLQTRNIDWYALASQSVAALAAILIRMSKPDIVAPLDVLNRNNVTNGQ